MRRRLRMLLGPESAPPAPSARSREAAALWIVGALWMAVCVVLARLDLTALMPGALAGGLVMAWGGRRLMSYLWFPLVAAAALLIEPLTTGSAGRAVPALGHLDLVVLAVVVLTAARAVTRRHWTMPVRPRPGSWRLLLALPAVLAVGVPDAGDPAVALRTGARVAVGYLVGVVICGRPARATALWRAAALVTVAAVIGAAHAAAHGGAAGVRAFAALADHGWHAPHALLDTMLLVVPVTLGYALDRSRRAVRWGLGVAGTAGVGLIAVLLAVGAGPAGPAGTARAGVILHGALVAATLAAGVVAALLAAACRPPARAGWTGLALGFALLALAGGRTGGPFPAPVLLFGAVGAGAVVGVLDHAWRRRAHARARARAVGAGPDRMPEPGLERAA